MKTISYETREEWMAGRRGKITGSKMKDILSKRNPENKKKGFYQLIADRISTAPEEERPMDRGARLEDEAIQRFVKESGKKVDTSLVMWTHDDNENIAYSPDGFMGKKECVECKCLNSASHIEAFLTQKIPSEYDEQKLQAFVVNDILKTLYFVFYDPRIACKDYFVIEVSRKDIEDEIAFSREYQQKTLLEVEKIVESLTF